MRVRVEFKPQDMWIGVYWEVDGSDDDFWRTIDIWVCIIPTLPIHISYQWLNPKGWRII